MLFELQGFMKPRQPDLLGYSRHLHGGDKKPPVASTAPAAGQFDDADGDERENGHHERGSGMLAQEDNNGFHRGSSFLPRCGDTQTSIVGTNQKEPIPEPRQPSPTMEASSDHPLQWLVEAACDRTQIQKDDGKDHSMGRTATPRTPRRVSLCSEHHHKTRTDTIDSNGDSVKALPVDPPSDRSTHRITMEDTTVIARPGLISEASSVSSDSTSPTYEDDEDQLKQPRKSFEEHYRDLLDFRKTHGHADVLTRGGYKGLGRWLSNLRCKFRAGRLPDNQAKLLRELGCIGFDDLECEDRPMVPKNYKELEAAAKDAQVSTKQDTTMSEETSDSTKNKENTRVTRKGELPPGGDKPMLRHYHHSQPLSFQHHPRTRAPFPPRGSRSHPIPPTMMGKPVPFGALRMPPPMQRPYPHVQRQDKDDWNYGLNQLNTFLQEYGHVNVSTTSIATNKKEHQELALWLAGQRHLHRKGQLLRERANALHSFYGCPGFEPSAAPAKPSVLPTASHPENAYPFTFAKHMRPEAPPGAFDPNVRAAHHTGYYHRRAMPPAKTMHSAEAIHAKLHPQQQQAKPKEQPTNPEAAAKPTKKRGQYIGWHDRLEQLVAFRKKNGHADVRIMMHDDCKELGRWLASQRHQYRKGKLPKDKIEILQRIGVNLAFKKQPSAGS